MIRPLTPADGPACDAIIASLPEWFGVEEGVRECAAAVRAGPGLAAVDAAGGLAGFLTWARRFPPTAEITWLAVERGTRRRGHGSALVEALAEQLAVDGVRFLLAKTLSSRAASDAYAETRAFYAAHGFAPLQELDIWGPENPCLLLGRSLATSS